jgi:hypothetical protein
MQAPSERIMLGCLVIAAALIVGVARRTYPRDVATALASEATTTTSERQLVA